jgi:hypothetical protein
MNNSKELFETVMETQQKAMNSFVETANKFQEAMKSENPMEKSTEVYKNWWESQMAMFNNTTTEQKTENKVNETFEKSEEFFKNMYTAQLDAFKKAADFNLGMYNTLNSFGKTSTETNQNFLDLNSTWNTLFESWNKTLNSTMHSLNTMMPGSSHQELFKNAMNTNALYFKLQEFYKPFFQAFQTKDFSFEGMKNMFDPSNYKKVTEELFSSFFPTTNLNTMLESNMKMVKDFFANNTTVNKDFQEYWKLFTDKFPHMISGDFAKFTETFRGFNTSLTETFSPIMKLVAPSKEKENVELAMVNFDKAAAYQLKLNELQNHLYKTGQHVSTDMFTYLTEKMKETTMTPSFQPFFNEWVNINEKHYTNLFSTEEFSKLKADLTTLSFEIKKNLEKQFENRIESLPLVVKSEMDELYKTIHDLKKTVKTLESKLSTETTTTTRTATKKAATV